MLMRVPTPAGWTLLRISRRPDALTFELGSDRGTPQSITVRSPSAADDPVQGANVSARLSAPELLAAAEHAALLALAGGLAQKCEDALEQGKPDLNALVPAGPSVPRRMEFGPESLLALLAPDLSLTDSAPFGWKLRQIVPASRRSEADTLALELTFEHPEHALLRVEIGAVAAGRVFTSTHNFSVSYLTNRGETAQKAELLVTWLSTLLSLRDGANLQVHFPRADAQAAANRQLPVVAQSSEWLNWALDAECGQACSFCSVKQLSPAWRRDGDYTPGLLRDLEIAAARGVRKLRLNGYDPLALPGIVELAEHITRLGFREVAVFSPCTRLSNAEFAATLFSALPPHAEVYVPVYGASSAVHDAVTGAAGSHAKVLQALDVLATLASVRVTLSSVAVKGNLHELQAIDAFAKARTLRLRIATPYPSSESPTDRFAASAVGFEDIVQHCISAEHVVFVDGVPACITLRQLHACGHGIDTYLQRNASMLGLPGREYASEAFMHSEASEQHDAFVASAVACPHIAECALSAHCPREVLRAYADKFGLGALAPVDVLELSTPLTAKDR